MPCPNRQTAIDIDDELAGVAAELWIIAAALDSRSLDIDRGHVAGALSILQRQIDILNAVRQRINPRPEAPARDAGECEGA